MGQTVGVLVEGKSPRQLRGVGAKHASPLRVLDPACGSGSFLLGAYQYLLDHYRRWYEENDPQKHAAAKEPPIYRISPSPSQGEGRGEGPGQAWRLTTAEKKRILLDHIYGVDIDRQAVEVTKLSLLLQVLEGETGETLGQQLSLWRERALPDLDHNIKCGNSLIGPDYFAGRLMPDPEEARRVNPFDWQAEFQQAMAAGGFDAVIGNPPYVLLQDDFRDDAQGRYFRRVFKAASYKLDTYHLFIERAIDLTKDGCLVSLITPANFLTNNYLRDLRRVMLGTTAILTLNTIQGGVFRGVSVDNTVLVLRKGQPDQSHEVELAVSLLSPTGLKIVKHQAVAQADFASAKDSLFVPGASSQVWGRMRDDQIPLHGICDVNFGMQLRNRKKFTHDVIELEPRVELPRGYAKCYTGRNISRYWVEWTGLACLEDRKARRGGLLGSRQAPHYGKDSDEADWKVAGFWIRHPRLQHP